MRRLPAVACKEGPGSDEEAEILPNLVYDPSMRKWLSEKKTETDPKVISSFHRLSSIFLLVLIAGLSAYLSWRLTGPPKDFYNNLWAPVHLLVRGRSPYNTTDFHPSLPALWFPMAVGFFSPLGFLSEVVATKAWFVLNIVELFVVILLSLRGQPKFYISAIIGFLVFLFPPLFNHIVLGQFSITAMFCFMMSAYFVDKRMDWLAAFFLVLGFAKPQLGILALPGLSFFYFQRGSFKAAYRFGAQIFLMSILMSLPLFIIYPAWIPDWLANLRSNFTWLHPSLFSILRQSIGEWSYILSGITLLIGLVICYQLWRKLPPLVAMMWSLGFTTIVTPYVWSWDFVLLIPVWVYTFTQVNWKRKIFLFGSYWIGWLGFVYIQLLAYGKNNLFWWVPLWFMVSVTLVTLWKTWHRDFTVLNNASNIRS